MVNIRYSTGLTNKELKKAEVQNNGGASTAQQAEQMFNNISPMASDFIGFETDSIGTPTARPKLTYEHIRYPDYNTGGWNIYNGISITFKEAESGFYGGGLSLYLNGTSDNWTQKYFDNDGVEQTTSSHIPQAATITIIPTVTTEIRKITFEFTSMLKDKIQITNVIVGGQLVEFTDILSVNLLEEINVISDDLPVNQLDLTVVSKIELSAGQELQLYSDSTYFVTFYTQNVDKISENYNGTDKVYSLQCCNVIGLLDDYIFDECPLAYFGGSYATDDLLIDKISENAKVDLTIQKDTGVTNYGVLGLIPIDTLRYFLCVFAWSICRWVSSARSNSIYLKKIPTSVSKTITDSYIIGNAIYKKGTPITSASWEHEQRGVNFAPDPSREFGMTVTNGTKLKVYYDNPPCFADINDDSRFSYVEWKANYFIYTASSSQRISGYGLDLKKYVLSIKGVDAEKPNEKNIEHFKNVGIKNFVCHTFYEYMQAHGETPSQYTHDYDYNLYKINSWNEIDNSNMLAGSKAGDIQKYIKSKGTVTAKVVLRDSLLNLQVGDMVTINTAYDGQITGIITKMNIHFGYNNTADIEIRESADFIS